MANHYFITGFPGFIASSLIRQIIRNGYDIRHIHLLVLPAFMDRAKQQVENIANEEKMNLDRFSLISGDITQPGLGMAEQIRGNLQDEVTHVFHLAALYDLAVPEDVAYNVNVTGTDHVNRWVLSLQNIQRYVYFSTCYVSGTREGIIYETELEMNQRFKNHYEHTKYEAEVKVRSIMDKVPTTIIRPGIVVGHSKSGETIKFDGPYFILIPRSAAKLFLSMRWFRKWVRVEKEALDYFNCIAKYDCSQAQEDLKGSGIVCPDFRDVIGPIVRFYKQHKDDDVKQLEIR